MKAIRTEHLTKSYGKARGIIDLNLEIEEGECVGFIGPNGAGKSTTIRTLLGLISPTAGCAYVLGKSVAENRKAILREVGYLPAEAAFYPGMRVRDVLKLSADLRKRDCAKNTALLCERLRLDPARKVDELSFGNRKKTAIVCALQSNPNLLILDEPTSGLDPLMQREFFDIIREYNRQGTTVFLSSHILSEVQHNCTRAAVIREGKLIACDRVAALARTSARRVSVSGDVDLTGLEGIRDLQRAGGVSGFLYNGDINLLLRRLAGSHLTDLHISEPDLEEIFMHYYDAEDISAPQPPAGMAAKKSSDAE